MGLQVVNSSPVGGSSSSASSPFAFTIPISQEITGTLVFTIPVDQSIYSSIPNFATASVVRPRVVLGSTELVVLSVVRVEIEEDVARTAEFSFSPPSGVVDLTSWFGQSVFIDFDVMSGSVVSYRTRLFTGVVTEPRYDPIRGVATMICSDDLQTIIDDSTLVQIDDLTPGAVFSAPVQGTDLTGFDYLNARMESLAASFDLSAYRVPRLTSWAAKSIPDFTFSHSLAEVIDDSEQVAVANGKNSINRVDVEFTYRYVRLRERRYFGEWTYPGSFCSWYQNPSDLPTKDMVISALQGTGWVILGVDYDTFLPANPASLSPPFTVNCGVILGNVLFNIDDVSHDQLITHADWTVGKRYAQAVEEVYSITVRAPQAQRVSGSKIEKTTAGFSADFDSSEWISSLEKQTLLQPTIQVLGPTYTENYIQDKDDVVGFDRATANAGLDWAIASSRKKILAAHRNSSVAFDIKLDPRLDVSHTVRLNTPRILAKGKVRKLEHNINTETGDARTTVQLAISRHDGADITLTEDLTRPNKPTTSEAPTTVNTGFDTTPDTQLGGKLTSPPFVEGRQGFSGNYRATILSTTPFDPTGLFYPVQFVANVPEIDQTTAGDISKTVPAEYIINIPQDQLVVTAP